MPLWLPRNSIARRPPQTSKSSKAFNKLSLRPWKASRPRFPNPPKASARASFRNSSKALSNFERLRWPASPRSAPLGPLWNWTVKRQRLTKKSKSRCKGSLAQLSKDFKCSFSSPPKAFVSLQPQPSSSREQPGPLWKSRLGKRSLLSRPKTSSSLFCVPASKDCRRRSTRLSKAFEISPFRLSLRSVSPSPPPPFNLRIQRQADLILHSATESCQAESERVARTLRESTLPKLAEEYVARTAQALQTTQRDVVNQATGQMKNAMQSTLESFRHELRTTQQQFKDEAQALLKLPVEQINQHARDTLEITREELASLRSGSIDETHAQLAAITRATLESITAEAKAIAEEYRAQLRDTFDALKEKGVTAVEGSIREAVERSRESLLRQLQSDAEDLTTIAVTQFRNKADEAIREAAGRQ